MKIKALALVGAMMALSALPAKAETKWTGFYVGAHGGYDMGTTDVTAPGFFSTTTINGLSSAGAEYGAHLGADYQIPGTPLVVGVGGDYTWSDAKGSATRTSFFGTTSVTVEVEKSWAVYGRLGLDMGRAMPYMIGGFTRVEAPGVSTDGWLVGGGVEVALSNNIYLGGEYRYSRLDEVTNGGATFDPERHEVRATLKFKTGGLF
jgi:outer membrane immunogenic protein